MIKYNYVVKELENQNGLYKAKIMTAQLVQVILNKIVNNQVYREDQYKRYMKEIKYYSNIKKFIKQNIEYYTKEIKCLNVKVE